RGRLLPSPCGTGRYTWYTAQQTVEFAAQPGFPALQVAGLRIRDKKFGVVNGVATMPLDVSGELTHALAAAQAGYRGEQARQGATPLDQEVAVIRAYFQMLEAQRLRDVTQQRLATTREQLENAEQRFSNGRLTKNELLVVQVATRNGEQELLQRGLAIDDARRLLNQTIGREVDAPTQVVDITQPPELPAVDEALRLAYVSNPVLASLVEEQQRLEETATSLARGRLPRFLGGGGVDYSSSDLI